MAKRDLITRPGFRFAFEISLPEIKIASPPSLSLDLPVYYKICFQEMLEHLQSSAKEVRLSC